MAKTLAERIISAKSTDRVTITDLEVLIADAEAERDRLVASAAHHDAESIDFALSDDDREEASRLTGHFQRTARGLANEIETLKQRLQDKQNSDKRQAEEARRAAILGRRDELAARLADRLPAIFDELVTLLNEIEQNDNEVAPLHLPSAEAIARGVPGNFYQGNAPITRFTKIKIPSWAESQNIWPIDRHLLEMVRQDEINHRRFVAAEAKRVAEDAKWSRYTVRQPEGFGEPPVIETRDGLTRMKGNAIIAEMTEEGVADARAKGCHVATPVDNRTRVSPDGVEMIA